MVAIKKFSRQKNMKGRTLHDYYTMAKKMWREDSSWPITQWVNAPNGMFCYSKFTHSFIVSERREGKRERQVMLPRTDVLWVKWVNESWVMSQWVNRSDQRFFIRSVQNADCRLGTKSLKCRLTRKTAFLRQKRDNIRFRKLPIVTQ